MVFFLNPELY